MERASFVAELAARLGARTPDHPLRVGIDGACGVGKSVLAAELVARIGRIGRPAVHLDSDGFHHVRAVRYRRGRESARGYYDDAYDFDTLGDLSLIPLGPSGARRYATRIHDLTSDEVVREWATAPADAVVVFDATFLQRGELRKHWDEVVYLDAPEAVTRSRGVQRDSAALGGVEAAEAAYATRYQAACRIYLDEEDPRGRASILVDHTDPADPRPVRWKIG